MLTVWKKITWSFTYFDQFMIELSFRQIDKQKLSINILCPRSSILDTLGILYLEL